MKHIGIVKPDTLVSVLNWIGAPIASLYVVSMFVYPFIDNAWNWEVVQNVWDRWQSLNVGMLAFISSIIAFNISRFNAKKQRERDFLAAKAFLPDALSYLIDYFESSATLLIKGWEANNDHKLDAEAPELPENYSVVFQQCIKYAEPDMGDYLAKILVKLQIHNSRLRGFVRDFNDPSHIGPTKSSIISYLYRLGELYALTAKLFPFARSEEDMDYTSLDWDDFHNAYANLNIWTDLFTIKEYDLEGLTKRSIERNGTIE